VARGRPIVVEWAANVRDFLKGTKQVERSVEDVADELQDAAKDADRFEDRFTDAMRDAERQADRSARRIEDDFAKAPGKLGEFGEDAGQEFIQNVGESVSAGDIDGIAQGIGGGLLSGLTGPLGLAAAGVGAVVLGVFSKVQAEQEALNQAITERAQTFWEGMLANWEAFQGAWTATDVRAEMQRLLSEEAERMEELRVKAEEAGVPFDLVVEALAGGVDAQNELNRLLEEAEEKNTRWEEATGRQKDLTDEIAVAIDRDVKGAIDDLNTELGITEESLDDANQFAQNMADVLGKYDGRTVTTTVVLKPGDAFTENLLNGTGP